MSKVDEILAQVDHLPSVPAIVQEVLAMTQDPEFRYDKLVELVRVDPGITAHVLRLCNSPYFGLSQKINSVDQALTFIGVNNLIDIVLSSKMVAHFQSGQSGYRLAKGELWRHSMACALVSRRLGERYNHSDKALLFTAGLMHDVGKLVLSEHVGDQFERIEALVQEEGKSFVAAEREVLGLDHALLGAAIARNWHFPEPIAHAIAFHHDLERAKKHRHTAVLVSLANLLVVSMGVGAGAEGLAAPVPTGIFAELSLKPKDLDALNLELKDILDQAQDLLNMAQ